MSKMDFSFELFSRGASDAADFLRAQQFEMSRCEHDATFHSHLAEFKKADENIFMLWDGSKQWLRLVTKRESGVEEELFFRMLRGADEAQQKKTLSEAVEFLQNYFSAHLHDEEESCCSCSHHHA